MLFYRVENDEGYGPYQSTLLKHETITNTKNGKHHFDSKHPDPSIDKELADIWEMIEDHENYVFGFISLKQLHDWFSTKADKEFLREYNYKISTYEVELCFHSKYQAIARKIDLEFVESIKF